MNDDIKDDLAYVKALAEEGRDTPLVGGAYYVLWGGVIAPPALVSWLNEIDIISLGSLALPMWVSAFVIGWALSMVLGRRIRAKPGATTLGNNTAGAVWFAVGVFMTLFWVSIMFVHDNFTAYGVPPYFLFNMMFPVAFGLYGVAFYATATAVRARWLKFITLASFLFSIASLIFMPTPHQPLIAFFGLIVCAIAPGIKLMREEPSEIV